MAVGKKKQQKGGFVVDYHHAIHLVFSGSKKIELPTHRIQEIGPTVGPTFHLSRTPKKRDYLIAGSQLRGPLGFGPIQILMERMHYIKGTSTNLTMCARV